MQFEKPKVLHAEPLYIDLIRDLGARKGEKEWNFGFGLADNLEFDSYEALVEYEWAPIDRLGLEVSKNNKKQNIDFNYQNILSFNINQQTELSNLKFDYYQFIYNNVFLNIDTPPPKA